MSSIGETIKKFKDAYGKPPEGFDAFLKTCRPLVPYISPSSDPEYCMGYELPSGLRLHDLMMQPYYESRQLVARPTDVLVASYPKTGTTWTQEICYLILNNIDLEKANSKTLEERIPFIEIPPMGIKGFEKLPDPRVIKTHLPYEDIPQSFLQNKTKIVYIARNPKDTAVSYYHFMKMLGYFAYSGTLEDFVDLFVNDTGSDHVMYHTYVKHALEYWKRRNEGTVLFLTYEGMQKDFIGGIRKVAQFLGKTLTDEQVDQIAAHCSFESMSKNPMTNYSQGGACVRVEGSETCFMRKGKVGDWKNRFTPEMSRKMEEYVAKHLQGTGLEFEYEI